MKRKVTKASNRDKRKRTSEPFNYPDSPSPLVTQRSQVVAEAPAATAAGTIAITKYQQTRFWAVWLNDELLAVVCYKKGARAIRNLLLKMASVAILCLTVGVSEAACFTGTVTRVVDGDTIVVGTNMVRLAEIDAPEMKQPYGPDAKNALADMILRRTVVVQWKRRGRYRRIIGQVYLGGDWINCQMVVNGWARQFRRYSKSATLAKAEAQARRGAIGFW